jgi:hypothetical protein
MRLWLKGVVRCSKRILGHPYARFHANVTPINMQVFLSVRCDGFRFLTHTHREFITSPFANLVQFATLAPPITARPTSTVV